MRLLHLDKREMSVVIAKWSVAPINPRNTIVHSCCIPPFISVPVHVCPGKYALITCSTIILNFHEREQKYYHFWIFQLLHSRNVLKYWTFVRCFFIIKRYFTIFTRKISFFKQLYVRSNIPVERNPENI